MIIHAIVHIVWLVKKQQKNKRKNNKSMELNNVVKIQIIKIKNNNSSMIYNKII